MKDLEKLYSEFLTTVSADEQNMTQLEATFHCLQGVVYLVDKMVNVGFRDLLNQEIISRYSTEKDDCWCDVHELCRKHPELRKSNVVSRRWRLENDFPCKGSYKSRQWYYEPDVIKWVDLHLRGDLR